MCEVCGCGDPTLVSKELHETILSENDRVAGHNRAHFDRLGAVAIDLMGSPGAGKTALLEATARVAPDLRLRAVSGDLATEHDAERLERAGIPARTITTGTACHLDATMLHHVLHEGGCGACDLFFIENVGNLVCPAIYDLGETARVVVLSVTEGVDKPLKYPVIFRGADLVLLTKADLLPHLPDVEPWQIHEALSKVMPEPHALLVSAVSGEGLEAWARWLRGLLPRPARADAAPAPRP